MSTLIKPYSPPTSYSLLNSPPFLNPFVKIPPRKHHYSHFPRAQITKNVFKAPVYSKPKPLDLDLSLFNPADHHLPIFDVIVIGAGPAGLRLAEKLSKNGVKVCVVDPSPLSMWPRTYGVWVDEFENLGLQDCFEKTWSRASVFVNDGKTHDLSRAYGKVDRKKLKLSLLSNCVENRVEFHKAKVVKVEHRDEFESWICCDDGAKLEASLIVDAGGFATNFVEYDRPRNHGFQIAYGVFAEVDQHPFELDKMVLIDLRDSHLENDPDLRAGNLKLPSFLYALPMDSNHVFIEEAILVGRPAISILEIKKRLDARLKHLGIRVKNVIESEEGAIPLGGPLPRIPQRTMAFGGSSGLIHPSTAFMMAQAMAMAPILADAITECLGSGKSVRGKSLHNRAWNGLWPLERRCAREFYSMGMEVMLKFDLNGIRRFLDAFFEMDPYYFERFFSSRLSYGEMAMFGYNIVRHASNTSRLELAWKSPGPLVKSMGNLALEAIKF